MKEELKEVDKQKQVYYVFNTTTGTYLQDSLCQKYNIGDKTRSKKINGIQCTRITSNDLEFIKSQEKEAKFKTETIFDLQLVLKFTVYVDTNHNKLYVANNICDRYNIKGIEKRIIKGSTYYNVTEGDIKMIEDMTKDEKILLKKDYVEINLADEMKPAEYLFIYYYDLEDKTAYVQRNILELARANGIEIEGKPKVIENKNCYSITEEQLKEIEAKTNYNGVEKIIKPKLLLKLVDEKLNVTKKEVTPAAPQQPTVVQNPNVEIPVYKTINAFREFNREIVLYQDIHSKKIFTNESTMKRFHLEKEGKLSATINGEECYEIDRDDALFIVNNANNSYSSYNVRYNELPLGFPSMPTIFIYKDISSKKTFANKYVIDRFSLTGNVQTVTINNELFYEISYDDAAFIVEASNNNYSPYIVKIKELPLGLDLVIKKEEPANVPIEQVPYASENKVKYNEMVSSVKDDVLNALNSIGRNGVVTYVNEPVNIPVSEPKIEVAEPTPVPETIEETPAPVEPEVEYPTVDYPPVEEEQITETVEEMSSPVVEPEVEAQEPEEIIEPVNDPFGNMVEEPAYESNPFQDKIDEITPYEEERIIVYKDTSTGTLYIPEENAFDKTTPTKEIMNKLCYETNSNALEQIHNVYFIITEVYPVEKKTIDVVICNNNGKLFVSRDTLNFLNFYIEKPHKIKVNKEIFEEITADDVDLIRARESENLTVNIIFKHITPSKKRGN